MYRLKRHRRGKGKNKAKQRKNESYNSDNNAIAITSGSSKLHFGRTDNLWLGKQFQRAKELSEFSEFPINVENFQMKVIA